MTMRDYTSETDPAVAAEAGHAPEVKQPLGFRAGRSPADRVAHYLVERLLPQSEVAEEYEEDGSLSESSPSSPVHRTGLQKFRRAVRQVLHGLLARVRSGPLVGESYRLLDRSGPFKQSKGKWAVCNVSSVRRKNGEDEASGIDYLFLRDLYHVYLDSKMSTQILLFFFVYQVVFAFFALIWKAIAKPCGIDLKDSWIRAYLLSLETTTGLGVPDPYMKGCWQAAAVLTVQNAMQLLLASILIGVMCANLARPQSRANCILFSEKAVIRYIDGAHYLMFRVCDLRVQHALIEPHVRMYCIHHHPRRGYEMVPMRMEHPDDELGGMLLMTLPFVCVHRIDAWSPLAPEIPRSVPVTLSEACRTFDPAAMKECREREHFRRAAWPGTLKRQVDCESGSRSSSFCPTCGESFTTTTMLQLHCKYLAHADAEAKLPPELRHRELPPQELKKLSHEDPTREEIEAHLQSQYLEVVVLVEGVEPSTSSTVQARYSYVVGGPRASHDVVWDMDFVDCCIQRPGKGESLALDVGRFHLLEPRPPVSHTRT